MAGPSATGGCLFCCCRFADLPRSNENLQAGRRDRSQPQDFLNNFPLKHIQKNTLSKVAEFYSMSEYFYSMGDKKTSG
jgi:hypothetical protein